MRNFGKSTSSEKWGEHIVHSQAGCNGLRVSPIGILLISVEHNLIFGALMSERNMPLFWQLEIHAPEGSDIVKGIHRVATERCDPKVELQPMEESRRKDLRGLFMSPSVYKE